MKKDIIKKLGGIAGEIAKEGLGKSGGNPRTIGDVLENVTDFIIDHVTSVLGGVHSAGGERGGGKGGGRGQGGGGRGGGRGCS